MQRNRLHDDEDQPEKKVISTHYVGQDENIQPILDKLKEAGVGDTEGSEAFVIKLQNGEFSFHDLEGNVVDPPQATKDMMIRDVVKDSILKAVEAAGESGGDEEKFGVGFPLALAQYLPLVMPSIMTSADATISVSVTGFCAANPELVKGDIKRSWNLARLAMHEAAAIEMLAGAAVQHTVMGLVRDGDRSPADISDEEFRKITEGHMDAIAGRMKGLVRLRAADISSETLADAKSRQAADEGPSWSDHLADPGMN